MPTHRVLRSAAAKAARSSSRGPWTFSIPLGAVLAGLTVLAGCGAHAAPEVRGPDELVLLVGGDQPSLRAALVARGLQPAPPRVLTPLPVEPVGRGPVAGGVRGTDDEIQREPVGDEFGPQQTGEPQQTGGPQQPRAQTPDDEWVIVPLPKGETLIHVARRHLGDGRRFIDLMKWNGWSDEDTRRLSADTPVRIRRSEMP